MANLWDSLKQHIGETYGTLSQGLVGQNLRADASKIKTGGRARLEQLASMSPEEAAMSFGNFGMGVKKLPLERAAEQGYHLDMPLYHGTTSTEDFEAFKPSAVRNDGRRTSGDNTMSFATDPSTASRFAFGEEGAHPEWWMPKTPMPRGRVIPAYVRGNLWDYRNPEHVNLAFEHLKNKYSSSKDWHPEWYKEQLGTGHWGFVEHDLGKDFFKSNGFTGAHVTEADAKNVIMFDPTAIRGKFAKFNKKDMKSSNLLASGLLAALLLKDGKSDVE